MQLSDQQLDDMEHLRRIYITRRAVLAREREALVAQAARCIINGQDQVPLPGTTKVCSSPPCCFSSCFLSFTCFLLSMPTSICSSQDHDPLPGRVKISNLRFLPLHPFLYPPPQPLAPSRPPPLHFPILLSFTLPCSLLLSM